MAPKKKQKPNRALLEPAIQQQRSQLTVEEKIAVLNWFHENGRSQVKTVLHFQQVVGFEKLHQSSISRWLRDEDALREEFEAGNAQRVRPSRVRHPELEVCLSMWVDRMEENHSSRLTGDVIKQVAGKFYDKLGVPPDERLSLSNGWLARFKDRQGLSLQVFHGEAASAPDAEIYPERTRVAAVIAAFLAENSNRSLDDVWNADETSFFYACVPDRGLARSARPGVKQSRTRLTLCLAVNATGSERLPSLFIGKFFKPRFFNKKTAGEHGFQYFFNKSAWMTGEIFAAWLHSWNSELRIKKRTVLLLLDNFSGHKIRSSSLSNIKIEFFAPNLTAHVQPCDAGIIRAFKAYFRRLTILRTIDKLMTGKAEKDMFAIDQLTAMNLAMLAWNQVKDDTIENCWSHTQILPEDDTQVGPSTRDTPAVEELQEALTVLRVCAGSHGHSMTLMSSSDFVDLDSDDHIGFDLCMEEIFDIVANIQVSDSTTEREVEVEEPVNDEPAEVIELLTPMDVYSSLLKVERYWQENSFNGALKLTKEVRDLLWNTRTQLQKDISAGKKQTTILDYFSSAVSK